MQAMVITFMLFSVACGATSRRTDIRFRWNDGRSLETRVCDTGCAIFSVSEYLRNAVRENAAGSVHVELDCEPRIFDMVAGLFGGAGSLAGASADDIVSILRLSEHLVINSKDERALLHGELSRLVRSNSSSEDVQESSCATGVYALRLLRRYAGAHGIDVRVKRGRATLCPLNWHLQQYGSAEREEAVLEMKVLESAMSRLARRGVMCSLGWFLDIMGVGTVNIAGCKIGVWTLELLRNAASLTALDVSNCAVDAGCFGPLLRVLRSLTDLDASWVSLRRNELCEVEKAHNLARLCLNGCGVLVGRLPSLLSELNGLVELSVSHNSLHRKDICAIKGVASLEKLSMSCCGIRPGYLTDLHCKLSRLRELDVSYNDLSTNDLQEIAKVASLERLDIGECKIERGGVQSLQTLYNLKELCILNSKLDNDDLLGVGSIKSLQKLSMRRCKMHSGSLRGAFCKTASLRHLDASYNSLDKEDLLEIGNIVRLEVLDIRGCAMASGCVSRLQKLKHLKELYVSHCSLCSEDLLGIGKLKSLMKLSMLDCSIEPLSLKHLRGLENLRELNVSCNSLCTYDVQEIGQIRSLTKLCAKGCSITSGSLKHLLCSLAGIEKLDVSYNCLDTDDFSVLGGKRTLVELNIRGCEVEPGSLRFLLEMRSLKVLHALGIGVLSQEDNDVLSMLRQRGVCVSQS